MTNVAFFQFGPLLPILVLSAPLWHASKLRGHWDLQIPFKYYNGVLLISANSPRVHVGKAPDPVSSGTRRAGLLFLVECRETARRG